MTVPEFEEICAEVFKTVTTVVNGKQIVERKWFPTGCTTCVNVDSEECLTNCLWLKDGRYWKYNEVRWFYIIHQAVAGGFPIDKVDSVSITDFVKLGIMAKFANAGAQ